jgi:hypothetical protein
MRTGLNKNGELIYSEERKNAHDPLSREAAKKLMKQLGLGEFRDNPNKFGIDGTVYKDGAAQFYLELEHRRHPHFPAWDQFPYGTVSVPYRKLKFKQEIQKDSLPCNYMVISADFDGAALCDFNIILESPAIEKYNTESRRVEPFFNVSVEHFKFYKINEN